MKLHPGRIEIEHYNYPLTEERIAKFPMEKRDASNLLIYKDGIVSKEKFKAIDQFLPEDSLLVFNETKVIQARMRFYKDTGAKIEVFVLEPWEIPEIQQAFLQTQKTTWKCFIGNAKKWKNGKIKLKAEYDSKEITIHAEKVGISGEATLVEFSWIPSEMSFAEVLNLAGIVPLPPYLNREAEKEDKDRYQTIYAQHDGSVAAPTAGLHFTDDVFERLKRNKVSKQKVTLHVGAGTFKPVSSEMMADHEMHTEKIIVEKKTVDELLNKIDKPLIAVGTTTVRTIESLYWFGVKLIIEESPEFQIKQWDPYNEDYLESEISSESALIAIKSYMEDNRLDHLHGETQLIIAPSYQYRLVDILITNFHQPKSTLLLLVAAFIGEEWKKAYHFALENDFRFLSYGDSCLFFRK